MSAAFAPRVLQWFVKHGRHDLPWQRKQTPYAVWVSEVMLQQTQVSTVIPYYSRFMRRFPSIKSLSAADIDEVLRYWSGLGYYARARHLHRCAQVLHERYHGRFPQTVEEVSQLPGIGRSTAGAILSLSRNIAAPILDGNVKRVLARYFLVEGAANSSSFMQVLWDLAEQLMPSEHCRDYNQAMMDLGALVCTRSNPNCLQCPLRQGCQAFKQGLQSLFPNKKRPIKRSEKRVWMLMLQNEHEELLLCRRPPAGIWGGLWSFPECEEGADVESLCEQHYGCRVLSVEHLSEFKHIFSHFDLWITPVKVNVRCLHAVMDSAACVWYNRSDRLPGGIPAPMGRFVVGDEVVL